MFQIGVSNWVISYLIYPVSSDTACSYATTVIALRAFSSGWKATMCRVLLEQSICKSTTTVKMLVAYWVFGSLFLVECFFPPR